MSASRAKNRSTEVGATVVTYNGYIDLFSAIEPML